MTVHRQQRPLNEMTPDRLQTELMFCLRQMLSHERWRHGFCKQACDKVWPCDVFMNASLRFREVSIVLGLP